MEIGQEIIVKEDFKINTTVSDKVKTVKKGDKGYLDSKGFLHLVNGAGKGKIVNVEGIEVKGYDHENIASMIFGRLSNYFNLDEMLENEGIDSERFKEEIEDVLSDIL